MGDMQGKKDCFLNPFMHRSTEVAYPEPTKVFLKLSPETVMLSAPFKCTHPSPLPLSHPFCSNRTLPQVTSQDVSFMPDIPGYIRERVNVNRCANYLTLKFNTLERQLCDCLQFSKHNFWKNTMWLFSILTFE